jgi:uncharacterized membrane protein YbaN (DUF454 family)
MPRRAKVVTLLLLWSSISATMVVSARAWWLRVLLLLIAAGVTAHVARIPAPRAGQNAAPERAVP